MVGVVGQRFDYFNQGCSNKAVTAQTVLSQLGTAGRYNKDDWSDWVMVQPNYHHNQYQHYQYHVAPKQELSLCGAMSEIYMALLSVSPTQVKVTRFTSQVQPKISVRNYLERIDKYFACSESVHVAALVYLDRLVSKQAIDLNPLTIHRLLAAATVVAAKFLDDIYYKNAYYAAVCGLSLKEMNKLEAHFISLLGWKLSISEEDYALYCETVRHVLR
eukprot:symbB.v1.2.021350.t1/scaffold1839.1/size99268/6